MNLGIAESHLRWASRSLFARSRFVVPLQRSEKRWLWFVQVWNPAHGSQIGADCSEIATESN
jgi:hypothetical protein